MGIYQAGPTAIRQLSVAQGALSDSIKFDAVTAIIDNFTDQYLHLPDVGRYVPPWTFSVIIPMNATNMLNALFQAPPGVVQAPSADTTQTASITYLAVELPASSGASGSPLIVPVRQGTWSWTALAGQYATMVVAAQGAASILLEGVITSGTYVPVEVYGGQTQAGPWTLIGVMPQYLNGANSVPAKKALIAMYPYLRLVIDNTGSSNPPATGLLYYQLSTAAPTAFPKRGYPNVVGMEMTNLAAGFGNTIYDSYASGKLVEATIVVQPAAANWVLGVNVGTENFNLSWPLAFSDIIDPPDANTPAGVNTERLHFGTQQQLVWMGGGYYVFHVRYDLEFDIGMVIRVENDSAATAFTSIKAAFIYLLDD